MRYSPCLRPTRFAKGMSLVDEEGLNLKVMTDRRGLTPNREGARAAITETRQ